MEKGVSTSEFWLTLAALVASSALLYTGDINAELWTGLNGGLVAWWTGSRTLMKVKNGVKPQGGV